MPTAALLQLPLWNDADEDAGWRVRRSARARRLAVRVFRDGSVEIVAPARVSPSQVATFMARHRAWILRQQRRLAPLHVAFPPALIELHALGERWSFDESTAGAGRSGRLPLQARPAAGGGMLALRAGVAPLVLRRAAMEWLCTRAAQAFEPQVQALAQELGVHCRRVQIRRQRTRWGSCSTRGTVSLNCCLLFQRPAVVRYLLVHELSHLAHMNHSERFWAHVGRFEPQWRELDAELAQGWNQVPGWALAALRA